MAKKHSTSALTAEEHARQDALYAEGHAYDYVIVGTGSAALTVGALLAHAGKKVCMLEAHDIAGGYVHSFKMGEYYFCAQVHYTWGCGPGGKVYEFLKKIGLEKDITFEAYDPEGYDHMVMPDETTVKIPYGYDQLVANVVAAYPDQKAPMEAFVTVMRGVRREFQKYPASKIAWWEYAVKVFQFPYLLRYRNKTMQDLFDECKLSTEAQAVLMANAGDMMSPPEELGIFSYVGLFGGYNTGAYYPTKHFKYYVDRLVQFITDHEGCHIYYETPVVEYVVSGNRIASVKTSNGKTFSADRIICNADPQQTAKRIGWEHFPESFRRPLTYDYSPAGMVMYLGLKDIDLKKYGFGRHNTWFLAQWDMNKTWKEQMSGDFSKPWVFISTPTLHSKEPGTAPAGHEIMEIATVTSYHQFREAQDRSLAEYNTMKQELAERLLDLVEQRFVPELRKHIALRVVGTSVTNSDFVLTPEGTAYGSLMTPKNMGAGRLKAWTPFENFYWCSASSGYGGLFGTVHTGMQLYMDLTEDRFYSGAEAPSDEDLVRDVRARVAAKRSSE